MIYVRRSHHWLQQGLPQEYPSTLTIIANLAFIIKDQGRAMEDIEFMAKCVQLQTLVLGDKHPDVLPSAAVPAKW